MNYKEIRDKFDSLDIQGQWDWFLKIDFKDKIQVNLDNDSTDFYFIDNDDAGLFCFKADIGNRKGVFCILKSLGFNVQPV